jgi:hypothetical protein
LIYKGVLMKLFLKYLFLFIYGSAVIYANPRTLPTVLNPDKNLLSKKYFYSVLSFKAPVIKRWKKSGAFEIENGVITLGGTQDNKLSRAGFGFDYSTMLVKELELSFEYDLSGKGEVAFCKKYTKLLPGKNKSFRLIVPVKADSKSGSVTFYCRGSGAKLVLKSIVVKPIRYNKTLGKPFLMDGKEAEQICYVKTNLKDTFFDKRAADILQRELFFAGAGVLPIKEIKNKDVEVGMIVIGQAAKECITNEILSSVREGGYAYKINDGIASIYGKHPSGTPSGVYAFLKKSGFYYLSNEVCITPESTQLVINKESGFSNPAVPMRTEGWSGGNSMNIGMSDPYYLLDVSIIGRARGFGHTMPYVVPWGEFRDSDVEFFAMQEDGVRRPAKRGDVHYCYTNKKLQNVFLNRIKEMLRSDPLCEYFCIFPGDGMNLSCNCLDCKKLGGTTDRTIYFANIMARGIKDEFPKVKLYTFSYTDTRKPPQKYLPESNLQVLICPYEPVWMNHLITHHEDNEKGWKHLKKWIEVAPGNIGAFLYPGSCQERLNLWPSFYANYEKIKFFARHKCQFMSYCGLNPRYGNKGAVPASGIFNSAQRYVLTKVQWNPELNVEKEIDMFFRLYYGDAAPALKEFFNLIHKEVKDRNWSQNTEKVIRGFVTQKLADRGMELFEKAQKAVANNQAFLDRVLQEKVYLLWSYLTDINRSNGKLKPERFSMYANCLAEFCRLGKTFNILNLGRLTFDNWFWETAMIKLPKKGKWYSAEIVSKLIKDPEDTLGKSIPRAQVKTAYGYSIPAKGMFGGRTIRSCSWLRENKVYVKQLYRQTSGFGTVQTLLTLDKVPDKEITMKVNGIDNEKTKIALMQLLVNGNKVYEGRVPWGKEEWSYEEFKIPPRVLKRGDNNIQFLNITPDKDVFSQGRKFSRNYYWGWYIIEECKFYLK